MWKQSHNLANYLQHTDLNVSREAIGAKYKGNNQTEIIEAKISVYVDDVSTHHNNGSEIFIEINSWDLTERNYHSTSHSAQMMLCSKL
jgi:hypothetical protein